MGSAWKPTLLTCTMAILSTITRRPRVFPLLLPALVITNYESGRRYHDLNTPGCNVVHEAGDKPRTRQCWNRRQESNVDGNGSARIANHFCLEITSGT